ETAARLPQGRRPFSCSPRVSESGGSSLARTSRPLPFSARALVDLTPQKYSVVPQILLSSVSQNISVIPIVEGPGFLPAQRCSLCPHKPRSLAGARDNTLNLGGS